MYNTIILILAKLYIYTIAVAQIGAIFVRCLYSASTTLIRTLYYIWVHKFKIFVLEI